MLRHNSLQTKNYGCATSLLERALVAICNAILTRNWTRFGYFYAREAINETKIKERIQIKSVQSMIESKA